MVYQRLQGKRFLGGKIEIWRGLLFRITIHVSR